MECWLDALDNSDRFGQYLDNLDWLDFVELLPGKGRHKKKPLNL